MKKIVLVLPFLMLACGGDDYRVKPKGNANVDRPPVGAVYDWDFMKASCFSAGCHNAAAPDITTEESAFKASKGVWKRIENGTMPPNNKDFDKEKALKYLKS